VNDESELHGRRRSERYLNPIVEFVLKEKKKKNTKILTKENAGCGAISNAVTPKRMSTAIMNISLYPRNCSVVRSVSEVAMCGISS